MAKIKENPSRPMDDRGEVSRRDVMSMIIGALVATALAGLGGASMAMRFLRPRVRPFDLFAPPDKAAVPEQRVASLSELQKEWDVKSFIFRKVDVEYTPHGTQITEIPGFAVHMPASADNADTHNVEVWSRICPHLGCIFNFEMDPPTVAKNYGGFTPPGPVFACPCHLSIYDLSHDGKVISGPAPRPPYKFEFKISGEDVIVTAPPKGLA
jgi:Rieske Fe-S protein